MRKKKSIQVSPERLALEEKASRIILKDWQIRHGIKPTVELV